MKQICLFLSDVAASLRRAPLVDELRWKPLSSISPLPASSCVSSRESGYCKTKSLLLLLLFFFHLLIQCQRLTLQWCKSKLHGRGSVIEFVFTKRDLLFIQRKYFFSSIPFQWRVLFLRSFWPVVSQNDSLFNSTLAHVSLLFHFCTPWKYLVFCRFQRIKKWNIGLEWVK